MMNRMDREVDISRDILENDNIYIINKRNIYNIRLGGLNDHLTFEVEYDKSKDRKLLFEPILVSAIKEKDRYYIRPIYSDKRFLINSEDYLLTDIVDSLNLGEIKTSNNRKRKSIMFDDLSLFDNIDSNYVYANQELVLDTPLIVSVFNLLELHEVKNLKSVFLYNYINKSEIEKYLEDKENIARDKLLSDFINISKNEHTDKIKVKK